jgi:hypothetical protein
MKSIFLLVRLGRAGLGALALASALGAAIILGVVAGVAPAAAATYVDAGTPDVKPEDKVVVPHPQPVQLIFQFETKGAPNGRATKFLKDQIFDTVKTSGLF